MGLSPIHGPDPTPVPRVGAGVVWDLGNVLVDWDASRAIAAGVGEAEAARFLAADDFDFRAYNHGPDSGLAWDTAEAEVARSHPHWLEHCRAYRAHFPASLVGEVPGTADLVRTLHAAGVPQWGLTNWSHELYPHAPRMFEVLALLDDVVVSGTEGLAKPDPRVYELLVARTGRPLADLVFVDDRPENVEAASALGMAGLVFTGADALRADLRGLGLPA
ncbi:HAD family phosphatase [Nocardioides sp. SOB44]|uniref:HAD family phosphatase n=1 Tax=Nocardioides cremeus TaxID=3058044 RepID=A0ABT8TXY1_9ACTN|nr:HAD family phosphatase [Nocardioides cremeus]MDO3397381.1 HAD family phosphatase [Nocardioides cremeus]